MFETSVVRVRAAAAPRRVGLLSASVAFHTLAAVSAVVLSVASTSFPRNAPNQFELFRVSAPLPPMPQGDPNAPRHQVQQPVQKPQQPQAPRTPQAAPPESAPAQIPQTTQPLPQSTGAATDTGGPIGPGSGAKWGDPNGDPNAIDVGQTQPAIAQPSTPSGPLMPVGDVHSARVLHRVDPVYPRLAIAGHMTGVVVVRCVIDKDGRPSNIEIDRSTSPIFNQSAVDAVRQWTFAPGTLHGTPVDTYFELTITFSVR
jgi:periplasmic protein TonB